MAEILGKFQFMEGSWKLPENDKIQVHLDLDSYVDYEKLKAKFQEMAEKADESGQAMNLLTGELWESPPHPAEKLTNYLAQAAAYLWGEARVSKEWDYEYNIGVSIICIEARVGNKMCRFMSQMTDEFFATNQKAQFFNSLKELCLRMDQQMPMQYAIMPKRRARNNDALDFALSFNKTTSSFEYLNSCGYLEQLDWYWDYPGKPFPERLGWEGGFYPEKNFWYENIQEGNSIQEYKAYQAKKNGFAVGGWVKGPHIATFNDMSDSGRLMRSICPGLSERVKLPCGCLNELKTEPVVTHLDRAIIHLNDFTEHNGVEKEWTRDEIADWLESLDIDLSLKDTSSMKKEEW